MKIELTKDRLLIDGPSDALMYDGQANFNILVKACVEGFVKIQNTNNFEFPTLDESKTNEVKIVSLSTQNVDDDCGIRDRLPNSIDELDKPIVDMTKVDTKQLPMKQYKNFRCPSCGQSALIKTLGELQNYCFRDISENGVTLLQIDKNHMEEILDYHFNNSIMIPIPKLFIDSTNPTNELYNISIIEESDIAITTDGTLECECPCCSKVFNFDDWYDAYKNTNKYFEYDPCYLCGSETVSVIQKNKSMVKCENENCNHTYDEQFRILV